jgi:Protein of unknown function (DUF3048) N-terminal domain/Protein of unknown function (DUF3048) C-terminal domain
MIRRSFVVVVALALLASCGGGKKAASTTTTTTTTTLATTTTAPPAVYPLTGLPATDPAKLARPALVVKIDNADGSGTNSARPQIGLNQADVVYEEMVEGSVTRLAAVFHSGDSDPVGPVRSARTTDIAVFTPLNTPLYAWSGANADFAAIIRGSALVDVGYDAHSEVYGRRNDNGHVAPHNLYSSTPELFALAPPDAKPPNPLFTYRTANEALNASAAPAGSAHLEFGGGAGSAPVDWGWDASTGAYLRSQKGSIDVDENGVQMTAQNVIISFVSYHDTGYVDPSGAPVPQGDLVGSGECWVLTNGMIIKGTWTKPSVSAITTYTDAAGAPIKLTPGRTWVELPPNGGASVSS